MRLYVCWGTWKHAPRPRGHPRGRAYHAPVDSGHKPEVIKSYGHGLLPDALNLRPGPNEARRLTGSDSAAALAGSAEARPG